MTYASLNGDLPRIAGERAASADHASRRDEAALRTELATTHARYRRAMKDAERAPDAASRRAVLAEARRLAAHASRLQTRIHDSSSSYTLRRSEKSCRPARTEQDQ